MAVTEFLKGESVNIVEVLFLRMFFEGFLSRAFGNGLTLSGVVSTEHSDIDSTWEVEGSCDDKFKLGAEVDCSGKTATFEAWDIGISEFVLIGKGLSVTELGAKSKSEKICGLNGWMPQEEKPLSILFGVILIGKATFTISGIL